MYLCELYFNKLPERHSHFFWSGHLQTLLPFHWAKCELDLDLLIIFTQWSCITEVLSFKTWTDVNEAHMLFFLWHHFILLHSERNQEHSWHGNILRMFSVCRFCRFFFQLTFQVSRKAVSTYLEMFHWGTVCKNQGQQRLRLLCTPQ